MVGLCHEEEGILVIKEKCHDAKRQYVHGSSIPEQSQKAEDGHKQIHADLHRECPQIAVDAVWPWVRGEDPGEMKSEIPKSAVVQYI
jgi:hypothetical protein